MIYYDRIDNGGHDVSAMSINPSSIVILNICGVIVLLMELAILKP